MENCSEINISFLKFCLEYCSPFPNLFENLKTGVAHKSLTFKKQFTAFYNLIADGNSFLAKKTVRFVLELCV